MLTSEPRKRLQAAADSIVQAFDLADVEENKWAENFAALQKENASLKAFLAERDKTIAKLKAESAKREEYVKTLQTKVNDQSARLLVIDGTPEAKAKRHKEIEAEKAKHKKIKEDAEKRLAELAAMEAAKPA